MKHSWRYVALHRRAGKQRISRANEVLCVISTGRLHYFRIGDDHLRTIRLYRIGVAR